MGILRTQKYSSRVVRAIRIGCGMQNEVARLQSQNRHRHVNRIVERGSYNTFVDFSPVHASCRPLRIR